MKRVIRGGVKVRYVGDNLRLAAAWGDRVCVVDHRSGDMACGYFPYPCIGNVVHDVYYAISCKDLEIVN